MRTYLELAALVIALLIGWRAYEAGYSNGQAACENASTQAAEGIRQKADESNRTASETNAWTQTYLWGALPPIDLRTQEARERVQIVYRDIEADPTADRCLSPARPASVQAELNEARGRVIAAARSALRPGAVSESQSRARLHQDRILAMRQGNGRLRPAAVRDHRGRGDEGQRVALLRE